MVGGPGNGKTDTVEGCIECLDTELNADGKLLDAFSEKFKTEGGDLAPRRVDVLLKDLGLKKKPANIDSVILVQDATANDPVAGKSAAELLREELNGMLKVQRYLSMLCKQRYFVPNSSTLYWRRRQSERAGNHNNPCCHQ